MMSTSSTAPPTAAPPMIIQGHPKATETMLIGLYEQ